MKGRAARLRRAQSGGFTLLELMVVVTLIAVLAVIATPAMSAARADRLAFDFARKTSELFHNGRARSTGRGAAHLVLFTNADGSRGRVTMFEGLDGSSSPGPNPSPRCRSSAQWAFVSSYVPGSGTTDSTKRARMIDGFSLDTTDTSSVVVTDDITMKGYGYFTDDALSLTGERTGVGAIVVCTTPNGTTFAGAGETADDAVEAMVGASGPFTGAVEVEVERHRGGDSVGITRRVVLASSAAPRIRSE